MIDDCRILLFNYAAFSMTFSQNKQAVKCCRAFIELYGHGRLTNYKQCWQLPIINKNEITFLTLTSPQPSVYTTAQKLTMKQPY